MNGKKRIIARIECKAKTPLLISSGEKSAVIDDLILKDCNGLPMIQGTSINGVLRHLAQKSNMFSNKEIDTLFGQSNADDEHAHSSLLRISQARFICQNEIVSENINFELIDLADNLLALNPIRQHVCINNKGTATNNGLYDHEVVRKGSRFLFEIELLSWSCSENELKSNFEKILALLNSPSFNIGGGSRKGFGQVELIKCEKYFFNLENENDLNNYLTYPKTLNQEGAKGEYSLIDEQVKFDNTTHYLLQLYPDLVSFIFGDNEMDNDADNKSKEETAIQYENNDIKLISYYVIPGSSIKGAVAHRFKYYLNKAYNNFIDKLNENEENNINKDYYNLLGNSSNKNDNDNKAGSIYIDDVFLNPTTIDKNKIFTHVAIDRFTGGALDSALFDEKPLISHEPISILIKIETDILMTGQIQIAIENTLTDICKGYLPLGGMVTKGHGIFTGRLFRDNIELFDYKKN